MGITYEKTQEMWDSVYPRLYSDKGPIGKPIIVKSYSNFIKLFSEPLSNGRRRVQWDKLPDFLKEEIETKRIFSDIDPYGEENWEE